MYNSVQKNIAALTLDWLVSIIVRNWTRSHTQNAAYQY